MNTDEMEAGRELDALIAEKVMGIKILSDIEMQAEAERVWKSQPGCLYFYAGFRAHFEASTGKIVTEQMFHTSSRDIHFAWQVVEKMKSLGFWFSTDRRSETWDVTFENVETCKEFDSSADTAPLAICRAALLAVKP